MINTHRLLTTLQTYYTTFVLYIEALTFPPEGLAVPVTDDLVPEGWSRRQEEQEQYPHLPRLNSEGLWASNKGVGMAIGRTNYRCFRCYNLISSLIDP